MRGVGAPPENLIQARRFADGDTRRLERFENLFVELESLGYPFPDYTKEDLEEDARHAERFRA